MTKGSELKKKTAPELHRELLDLLREQFNLRMQKGTGQLGQPHRMKEVRRDIARIRTVMNEQRKVEAS
ncbi:MAG: 50S ribosomal protein L29 [Gammaproteobacteria bacterium]|jgi:large subunit ribosomal protein L29|nr:50S ribosomal protein L29 [Gammaproteobacteria bacterium]